MKIGFSTSPAIISRLIRWATRSRISHTFILVDDTMFQQPMVMEADWGGFRYTTYDFFLRSNTVVTIVEPKVPLDAAIRKAAQRLGENYAFDGIFGMVFVLLGRWLRRKWRNPFRSAHSVFCSEENTFIVQDAGWPGAEKLDPYSTDPEGLEEFLTQ